MIKGLAANGVANPLPNMPKNELLKPCNKGANNCPKGINDRAICPTTPNLPAHLPTFLKTFLIPLPIFLKVFLTPFHNLLKIPSTITPFKLLVQGLVQIQNQLL